MKEDVNFMVTQETTKKVWCKSCNGAGKVDRKFGRRVSKVTCFMCKGTGTAKIKHRTEVPLEQALKVLQQQKNIPNE